MMRMLLVVLVFVTMATAEEIRLDSPSFKRFMDKYDKQVKSSLILSVFLLSVLNSVLETRWSKALFEEI